VIRDAPDGSVVDIKVIPRAGSTTLAGTRDGAVLIRLAAAPVDGAANAELIALLSRVLAIPKRHIAIISGEKTRSKRVKVLGVSAAMFRERFNLSPDAR
jgi:uncharacterized protein (TIGR00251 family)